MNNQPELTTRELGLRLHQAETATGIGRQTIRVLQAEQPVDHEAIEVQRLLVNSARLARNALITQLEASKQASASYSRYEWTLA